MTAGNYKRTVRLLQAGHSHRIVAEKLGLALGTIRNYSHRAQQAGMLFRCSQGRPRDILLALPPEPRAWLIEQIPLDGTLEDIIAAIITDAWLDATDPTPR